MKPPSVHNLLPNSVNTKYDIKYSELCGDVITIFRNNNNKWGALDSEMKLVVEPSYDSIFYHVVHKVLICVNLNKNDENTGNSYYFFERTGTLIKELHNIQNINTRSNEQFPYRNHDSRLWGLLDYSFNKSIEPKYDGILPLGKSVYKVRINNKFGLISCVDAMITPVRYDDILGNFSEYSSIIARENSSFVIINQYGSIKKKLPFNQLLSGECNSYGGRHIQNKGQLKSIIDAKLRKSNDETISDLIDYYNDLTELTKYEGKWGIISSDGNEVLPSIYSYVDFFNESGNYKILVGEIIISRGSEYDIKISGFKCGVISNKQETILESKFDWIDEISPTLFRVNIGGEVVYNDDYQEEYWMALGGKWGVIDNKGQIIVPIEYDNIMINWFRVKDLIIVQNGAKRFDSKLNYEAYDLAGNKIIDREINYRDHMYYKG